MNYLAHKYQDDDYCACGHLFDEHDPKDEMACSVVGCDCSCFDYMPDEDVEEANDSSEDL